METEETVDENIFNDLTAIEQVESKTKRIVSRQFYNVSGVKLPIPQHGLNIVKTRYEDGTENSRSVMAWRLITRPWASRWQVS